MGNISLKRRIPSAILLTTSRPTTARAVPARSPVRPVRSAAFLPVPLSARFPATPARPAIPGVKNACGARWAGRPFVMEGRRFIGCDIDPGCVETTQRRSYRAGGPA